MLLFLFVDSLGFGFIYCGLLESLVAYFVGMGCLVVYLYSPYLSYYLPMGFVANF